MIERSMLTANSDIQLGCTAEEFDNVTIRGLGKPFGGGLNPPDYDTIPQGATTREPSIRNLPLCSRIDHVIIFTAQCRLFVNGRQRGRVVRSTERCIFSC